MFVDTQFTSLVKPNWCEICEVYYYGEICSSTNYHERRKKAEIKMSRGREAVKFEEYESALKFFSSAINTCPEDANFVIERCDIFMSMKKYNLALQDALKAMSLDKTLDEAYYRAIDCYISIGDLKNADKIIELFQTNCKVRNLQKINKCNDKLKKFENLQNYINDTMKIKNYERSLEMIDDALKISPDNCDMKLLKIKCLVILEHHSEAEIMNDHEFKQYSDQNFYEAFKLYNNGDLNTSLDLMEEISLGLPRKYKSIEDFKMEARIIIENLANAEEEVNSKNYHEAFKILESILCLSNPAIKKEIFCKIGKIKMKQNNFSEAIEFFTSALQIDPSYQEASLMKIRCQFAFRAYSCVLHELENHMEIDSSRSMEDLLREVSNETEDNAPIKKTTLSNDKVDSKYALTYDQLVENREVVNKNSKTFKSLILKHKLRFRRSVSSCIKTKEIKHPEKEKAVIKNKEGGIAFMSKDYTKALKLYSEAIKLCPKNATFLTNRSACLIEMKRFREALEDSLNAIKADNSYWKGYSRAINVYLLFGDTHNAEKLIKHFGNTFTIERSRLDTLKYCQTKIEQFYNESNYEECLHYLEIGMKIAGACERFEDLKAECLVHIMRYDQAEKIIREALESNKNRPHMIFTKALLTYYLNGEELIESIQMFEQVLKFYSKFYKVSQYLSKAKLLQNLNKNRDILYKCGNFKLLRDICTQGSKVDPTNKIFDRIFFFYRGLANFNLQKYEEARDDFTDCLRIKSDSQDVLMKRAKTHFVLQEYEDCIVDCEEYIRIENSIDIQGICDSAKLLLKNSELKSAYGILEVAENASEEEIKKAFGKLSKTFHVDKHPNATAIDKIKLTRKFNEVKKAYESLKIKFSP